jgi:hypothetical protein
VRNERVRAFTFEGADFVFCVGRARFGLNGASLLLATRLVRRAGAFFGDASFGVPRVSARGR